MAESNYEVIFKNRQHELKRKDSNWRLIYDSYIGGVQFLDGNYLIRYPKESLKSFGIRKSRAVYFNQVSPLVDMLSGLLFLNEPTRKTPQALSYIHESISGEKKINEFMRLVSAYSFMFTCGILVDTPNFDPEEVKTRQDRIDKKLNPYAVLYLPFKIRDFNVNIEDGELDWIILDDSYIDHTDPFSDAKTIIRYTLWDRNSCQSFSREGIKGTIVPAEVKTHNLGFVPFRFVSWRDDNNDFIGETVCEDIAMISKLLYNNMSYMDEMLAAGTFKMLAYPTADGDIPSSLKDGGVGALSILPYDITSPTQPVFIGHELSDIDPFIKAMEFYMAEVLKKVGLSTDETKEFVKSGAAKRIDFQKMRALLVSGAQMMGKLEEWIFATAARWEKKPELVKQIHIEYTSMFDDEDLRTEVTMLTELLVHPVKKLKTSVLTLMVKKLLGNDLKQDELQLIYDDIEKSIKAVDETGISSASGFDYKAAANKIKSQKENTQ